MKVKVTVQYAVEPRRLPSPLQLRRWARSALKGVRRKSASVTVRIVGRAESRRLNARYRRRDQATNVLSFPFDAPPGVKSDLLGDLVICAPVVRAEARRQTGNEAAHWAHTVVHGILHLRGYDHGNDREAAEMEGRESRLMRAFGYPDPYARDPRAP